jgi:hypothetical protein
VSSLSLKFSEAEENVFSVLREKTGAPLDGARLMSICGFDSYYCTDCIAIALCAAQAEGNGWGQRWQNIF